MARARAAPVFLSPDCTSPIPVPCPLPLSKLGGKEEQKREEVNGRHQQSKITVYIHFGLPFACLLPHASAAAIAVYSTRSTPYSTYLSTTHPHHSAPLHSFSPHPIRSCRAPLDSLQPCPPKGCRSLHSTDMRAVRAFHARCLIFWGPGCSGLETFGRTGLDSQACRLGILSAHNVDGVPELTVIWGLCTDRLARVRACSALILCNHCC